MAEETRDLVYSEIPSIPSNVSNPHGLSTTGRIMVIKDTTGYKYVVFTMTRCSTDEALDFYSDGRELHVFLKGCSAGTDVVAFNKGKSVLYCTSTLIGGVLKDWSETHTALTLQAFNDHFTRICKENVYMDEEGSAPKPCVTTELQTSSNLQ